MKVVIRTGTASTPFDMYVLNKILTAYLLMQGVSWESLQEMEVKEFMEYVDIFSELEKINAEKTNGG